nr:pilus (MSHA type) biogenesis protein MshL [uncultured Desulfobulbus sp.]
MRMNKFFGVICLALAVPALVSCSGQKVGDESVDSTDTSAKASLAAAPPVRPAQLPVRFQSPSYIAALDTSSSSLLGEEGEEYQIRVGATIRSTGGNQPLWQVMKRLANLKGMTVSWASDVVNNVNVDVDIAADDKFFDAIGNLLRQVDYFYEVKGKNIIVRNKATKVYQIGIPAMSGGYSTNVGGNFLANKDAASGAEGTVKITSPENNFNVWESIELNLKKILEIAKEEQQEVAAAVSAANDATQNNAGIDNKKTQTVKTKEVKTTTANYSKGGGYFVIDKNVGLITVTAKPSLLKTVDDYIENLRNSMYQQVNIEAKIIEVYLQDNSRIGLNWDDLLGGSTALGTTFSFGNNGQVYPHTNDPGTYASTFVSRITMGDLGFDVFLNALKQQGDTHVLANPKITVLNGQPALISVGKDVAYIKSVTREKDGDTGDVTYTAETGNVVQGIALGVMASVLDDQRVILHLTPITTDLENLDSDGDIPLTTIGSGDTAMSLGLPKVKVREMSTMVEVQNGEMLIIGGLIDSTEGQTGSFAPGVGDIPVLKYLFGYEEKTVQKRELVILLTPRII